MTRAIKFFGVSFLLFVISVGPIMATAVTTEKDKNSKEQCDEENEKDNPQSNAQSKAVNYSAASQKSRETMAGLKMKSDSSSILSYNFIFYLVYKFKYSESEEEFSQESRTTD